MTDPMQHNCPHADEGWCLDCVQVLSDQSRADEARLEFLIGLPGIVDQLCIDEDAEFYELSLDEFRSMIDDAMALDDARGCE